MRKKTNPFKRGKRYDVYLHSSGRDIGEIEFIAKVEPLNGRELYLFHLKKKGDRRVRSATRL